MWLAIFISVILHILFIILLRKGYEDRMCTEKIKLPLYAYVIYFLIALIPYISFVALGIWIYFFIRSLINDYIYYAKGSFISFLNKKI